MRGYSVDVGQVIQNTKNEKGISERKQLEVDFVCNRGQDRIYIQSAYALLSEEKTEQELRSLKQIKDSFLKVVIVGGMQPTFRNDDGILILNIFDFLLNRSGQNLWPSKEGFDIVIGNPPYIDAKKLKHIASTLKEKFTVYSGTADLSIYFNQYSVNFYAASAAKLNISFILSLFKGVFGFFSNTSIIRCA